MEKWKDWSPDQTANWMQGKGMDRLAEAVTKNDVSGCELAELNDSVLRDMGIDSAFMRRKWLKKIRDLTKPSDQLNTPTTCLTKLPAHKKFPFFCSHKSKRLTFNRLVLTSVFFRAAQ